MNFFDTACQSGPYRHQAFGICDPQDSTRAYVDVNLQNMHEWIATVSNPDAKDVLFTAIDKCVIKDDEHVGRGRCDAMLTTPDLLYLIELKDQRIARKSDAIAQLESTVNFLISHHKLDQFRHKKVFVCNRKRRPFAVIDNETQRAFFSNYKFRIDVHATVLIVS